jgi:hypothetical protein
MLKELPLNSVVLQWCYSGVTVVVPSSAQGWCGPRESPPVVSEKCFSSVIVVLPWCHHGVAHIMIKVEFVRAFPVMTWWVCYQQLRAGLDGEVAHACLPQGIRCLCVCVCQHGVSVVSVWCQHDVSMVSAWGQYDAHACFPQGVGRLCVCVCACV